MRCQKIDDLQLSDDKWGNIRLFNDLLAHADNAQQAFSSDQATTLHLALPTLEALHKAWSKHAEHAKYLKFVPALNAGLAKIEEYYDRTAELLDLSQKTEHIRKYWGDDKLESILENAEEMYKKHYFEMYGNNSALAPLQRTGKSAMCKVGVLICELSNNEDKDGVESSTSLVAANDLRIPWHKDFNGYLNSKDRLGNMTIDEWWGWNATWYDVWASLACNMLPIMASSVSNIVEALQFLKCTYCRDLLFHEEPSTQFEVDESGDVEEVVEDNTDEASWEGMVEDLVDDEGFVDHDEDDVFVQDM
ncbi:hypothetical protein F5148DRAFT_1357372 [Russula earlei]|uniref:Uncharacterized protein n=1 Tax=Russula earlei TaxID=71964 RepID=A0ACC0TTS0_9AGAM|nr:hypothetical protein F5148DRAFT_1357372 [Russula earlei]